MYDRRIFYSLTMILIQTFCPQVFAKTKPILCDTIFINKKYQSAIKLWSNKSDSLITLNKQTLPLAYQIANVNEKIDASLISGAASFEQGEHGKAIIHYREAIKIAHKYHFETKEIQAMTEISQPLATIGAHSEALHYLDKAWERLKATDNIRGRALIIYNSGIVYYYQSMNKEAMLCYKTSLATYKAVKDSSKISSILESIGHIHLRNQRHQQALEYYNSSLKYARNEKKPKAIGSALISLGNLYSEVGQGALAITYYLEAKYLLEDLGEKTEYLRLLNHMAYTYLKQMNKKQAMYFAQLSYHMAIKQQRLYYINTAATLLSELYEQLKQPQRALDYYKISIVAQDRLYSPDNKEEAVLMKEKYLFEKQRREIDLGFQKHLYKKEMQIYMAFIAISFLLVLTIFLLLYIKQKKKLNKVLQDAKAAIEEQNISLKKANAFKKQLLSVLAHDIRTPLANAKMILSLFERKHISKQHLQKLIQSSQIEIDSLIMLLDNLLLWITFQISTKRIAKNYFSLEEITAETFALFRRQAEEKAIQLSMHICDNLEIFGDIESLKTVLRNLVSNAIKFSRKGGVVTVTSEHNETTNQTTIRIVDTGIGMSTSDLESLIKNPGYSQKGTEHEKGTGIGLHLCFQYTLINDSQLFVKSSIEKGTEIWFSLKGRITSQTMALICIPS